MSTEASRRAAMLGWLLATLAVTAAAVEPSLELDVPDAAVTVGDHVDVRVHARGGEDWLWGDLTVRVDQQGQWAVVGGPGSSSCPSCRLELGCPAATVGRSPPPTTRWSRWRRCCRPRVRRNPRR